MKLLIIEDEKLFSDMIRLSLPEDFEAEIINDVSNFFDVYEPGKYDLLLIDINLSSNTDGLFLARKIKEIDQKVKIVMLTRYDYKFQIKEAFQIPVDGYIIKTDPINSEYLANTLRKVLEGEFSLSKKVSHTLAQYSDENLTKSQVQIIELLKKNKSIKEIAYLRHSKTKTVRNQIDGIYKVFGIHSFQELMNRVYS